MVKNEENLFWCKGPKQAMANGLNVQSSRVSLKHCSGVCTEGAIPAARAETENPDTATTHGFLHREVSVKTLAEETKSSG